ncbi:MAG: glycosyltransferase family 39 protein [Rhodocyclaceae bacterium]|nr:glycosyltransferase family 39 protein [Rhodocyclaceae bacterium]
MAILLVGLFLRVQQLGDQWLTDDEWHAVHRVVAGQTYAELASTVGAADYSIPQALLYKFLAAGGGLDERTMRLPMVAAGLVMLVAGTVWARRRFGWWTGYSFAVLLAISPFLVNYSRTARPYAITCLLVWLSLFSAAQWVRTRSNAWGACYGVAATFACWLHMAAAPFALAPLAWVAFDALRTAWRDRQWQGMVPVSLVASAVVGAVGILCIRPMLLSRSALASRLGSDLPDLETLVEMMHLWVGSGLDVLVGFASVLALVGSLRLWRTRRDLLLLLLAGTGATLAGIYLSKPAWIQNGLTMGRYLLPLLPAFLLAMALGIVRLSEAIPARPIRILVSILLPWTFLVGSPHADMLRRPNNFTLHYWYQFDYREAQNPVRVGMKAMPIHSFWASLASAEAGTRTIAVAGHGLESFTVPDVRWQTRHHQYVVQAQLTGYCKPPPYIAEAPPSAGFALHNAVELGDMGLPDTRKVDFLVFEKHGSVPVGRCIEKFKQDHGMPFLEDDALAVFDLRPSTASAR